MGPVTAPPAPSGAQTVGLEEGWGQAGQGSPHLGPSAAGPKLGVLAAVALRRVPGVPGHWGLHGTGGWAGSDPRPQRGASSLAGGTGPEGVRSDRRAWREWPSVGRGDVWGANRQAGFVPGRPPPAWVLRPPHAPTPTRLLATFSGAWANAGGWGLAATGLGTAQGWPGGAAGRIRPRLGLGATRPAWPVPAPGEGVLGAALGWHPGRGGARAGGLCVLCPSLPGPPPGWSCQTLRKRDKGPGGPRRAGTQAGDGVLMTDCNGGATGSRLTPSGPRPGLPTLPGPTTDPNRLGRKGKLSPPKRPRSWMPPAWAAHVQSPARSAG